tara:strand:- start:359 stop:562 length:204 start_codon:yes stop_codon:yes gene_type:complete
MKKKAWNIRECSCKTGRMQTIKPSRGEWISKFVQWSDAKHKQGTPQRKNSGATKDQPRFLFRAADHL